MRATVDAGVRVGLVILMGLLVLDVVWQVFSRYVLASPSTWTDELARFLLIWVSLLGGAYASGQNMHLAIDLFPNSLDPPARRKLNVVIDLIVISFALFVLVIGGGMVVYYTAAYTQLTPTLQIPMAWVYLIGPITGLLVIFYKVSDILGYYRPGPEPITPIVPIP